MAEQNNIETVIASQSLRGTKQSHPHIPELRFKEFDGEWSEKKLNDIAEFQKGKGISKADISEDGILECIRYGELYTTYSELIENVVSKTNLPAKDLVLSEYNDVIIPASGESNIDIATASCVLKTGVAFSGDLNIIRSKMNGIFLSFYLNNKRKFDIAKLAQGVSVVHLYISQLKTFKLNIPTLPEQQKIATFLASVDEKIQQLTKKKTLLEQYKKGVMQQLFSGKLRFKPNVIARTQDEAISPIETEYPDWEEKRLGDLSERIGDGIHSTPKYDDSGNYYFINGNNLSNGKIIMNELTKKVTETEYLKHNRALGLKTILLSINGTIGNIAFYNNEKIVLGKSACYINLNNTVDLMFIYLIIQSSSIANYFISELTGSTIKNLSLKTIRNTRINLPCLKEQQKIATYLSSIDTKIERVNNQITQTQSFKKGLLQQLFV